MENSSGYGGLWPLERFAVHGVDYAPAAQPKSDIYLSLLPLLNSGRVELWITRAWFRL